MPKLFIIPLNGKISALINHWNGIVKFRVDTVQTPVRLFPHEPSVPNRSDASSTSSLDKWVSRLEHNKLPNSIFIKRVQQTERVIDPMVLFMK